MYLHKVCMFHIFLRHLYVCLLQYDHKLDSWLGWVWHECVYSGIWQAQQVCVELPTSAINVTLLAFAAERRAANENHATIRFVCVTRCSGARMMAHTDREKTDGRQTVS